MAENTGRSQRGLLAGLRSRGLRPAHFCEVEALRLLLAAFTLYSASCLKITIRSVELRGPASAVEATSSAEGCFVGRLYPKTHKLQSKKIPATSGRSGQPVPLGTPAD